MCLQSVTRLYCAVLLVWLLRGTLHPSLGRYIPLRVLSYFTVFVEWSPGLARATAAVVPTALQRATATAGLQKTLVSCDTV